MKNIQAPKLYQFLVFAMLSIFNSNVFAEDETTRDINLKLIPDKQAGIKNGEIEVGNGVFESQLTIRSDGTAKLGAMSCQLTKGQIVVCLNRGLTASILSLDLDKMRFVESSVMTPVGDLHYGELTFGILRHAE